MKRTIILLWVAIIINACNEPSLMKQTIRVPIYKYSTEAEAEANLQQMSSKESNQLGSIYVYNDYLFINEKGEGLHIYDNSDSANPTQISFMQIPGNFDLAIANDILFADSFDDLLSFDISNINNFKLLERKNNVFPAYHPSRFGVLVGYKDSVIYVEDNRNQLWLGSNDDFSETTALSAGGGNVGVGGSLARFTFFDDHLYTVDRTTLRSFDVSNPNTMMAVDSQNINAIEVETIFNYQGHLFVGTTNGVFLYEAELGGTLQYKDVFTHATACDPVYVSDDVAFVTLRSNNANRCFNNLNQLDIIDASDFDQLKFIKTVQMTSPHGLGVQDSLVFICEGQHGIKVYDYEKVMSGTQLSDVKLDLKYWNQNIEAVDVIPFRNHLIVVNQNSLLQYSYNSQGQLQLISTID